MTTTPGAPPRRFGVGTATLLVVASMVGTGVFTTSGYLVRDIGSAPAVLAGWLLGGVAALCGALTYGELAAALPENGGEFHLLRRIYHPSIGFASGLVSLVVGFAAPTAASAIAFGEYLDRVVPGLPSLHLGEATIGAPTLAGVLLVLLTSAVHAARAGAGGRFQDVTTGLKVLLILALVGAGATQATVDPSRLGAGARPLGEALLSSDLAMGLVWISFSYSGWNAAIYLAGEVRDPQRTLPRALGLGTAAVTVLYLFLNALFLAAAPAGELAGQTEVAHVAASHLFGEAGGRFVSALIALGLVSTVGALVMTGARVTEAMGRAFPRLGFLGHRRESGGPTAAIALQGALALLMALTSSFDALLTFIGLTLSVVAGLTAAGVFVLRVREPSLARPYRTWGYPATPLVFLALTAWMVVSTVLRDLTREDGASVTLVSAGTLLAGPLLWLLVREPRRPAPV